MLSRFLVTKFVKDYENISNSKVRDSYGYLGGIVGIIVNIILFLVKLFVGLIAKSIAVTADAFNNLSDALSSIITIAGFKFASKPADEEHPFGHGRIEYLSGLLVAFMVMLVGFEFIKSSFNRIINPNKVNFDLIPFILILVSIGAKIWLSRFNKYIGKKINSSALQASSLDALGDVITSSTVALSLLLSKWISIPIDGYIGILVSLFILYSGYSLIKDTINPILGEAPDPEFVKELESDVLRYDCITGVHDIIIHNYGPGRRMASLHVEVPCNISVVKIHEIIDTMERELSKKHNMFLVVHMDPINTNDKEVESARMELESILKLFPEIKSYHDFRVVGEGDYKNLIFDIVVSPDFNIEKKSDLLETRLNEELKKLHPKYNAMITIDKDYL
ncbi:MULTISPECIES: cation diffusion facilitator family transporter [Clostridium]|jgi:cation diffusion facilitator family transporter|uniref:Ferrous-iron efflux pump FieF n=2 Tax=Clostridium TaxID=1485 RepID=A0A151ANG5_9CLOT|nr:MULTISPECIES: cation diffusion facilitator family transporter [Clostridium]KYH29155.1 ferrous-iron efflux pump FieF [Clostridium colicanis DSM 13634]MBE6043735.1 cation transporter [Clostridium thermopalmarium]PRR73796.1 Ferrous-iron efflux pump FieF [Clostridium thermopalmarium DSM 5974]PVZ21175.1 cation diffusion facilitator family transporter [Clostridium thermopalmarium DSM 5974]